LVQHEPIMCKVMGDKDENGGHRTCFSRNCK
jgi:hypothetical protein